MSARAIERPAPFVLLASGRGGVGKTTLCANLGVHLALHGLRVLLVDLDLGLASLNLALDLQSAASIEDALGGRTEVANCVIPGPGGVDVLPGSSGNLQLASLNETQLLRLCKLLDKLRSRYDLILGDGASGIIPDRLNLAAHADRVWLVTAPELASISGSYGWMRAFDEHTRRIAHDAPTPQVVVNQALSESQAREVADKLAGTCRRFLARSPEFVGWLPRSEEIRQACLRRRPFVLEDAAGTEQRLLSHLAMPLAASASASGSSGRCRVLEDNTHV